MSHSYGSPGVWAARSALDRHYEGLAKPFEWKFTRADLTELMRRLEEKRWAAAA